MMRKIRRILHPTDFSRAAQPAFAAAVALARQNRARLLLLHVIARPRGPYLGKDYMTAETYAAIAGREAEAGLATALGKARKAGVRAMAQVVEGIPFVEILRVAKREGADLIVMGTHGRTGLSHLLLGSVTERVVRLAPCPVLTLHGRDRTREAGQRRASRLPPARKNA